MSGKPHNAIVIVTIGFYDGVYTPAWNDAEETKKKWVYQTILIWAVTGSLIFVSINGSVQQLFAQLTTQQQLVSTFQSLA